MGVSKERKSQGKKQGDRAAETSFHRLVGRRLDDVSTLGKELFMIFGEICLRVHFLMSGSFRVNGQQLDRDHGSTADTVSLEVTFGPDTLSLYKCAVDIRDSQSCLQRYEGLHDLDICSPVFNHKRAVALVMEQRGRQVCDVLLDQTILPGVGNIIKNEALFDSGIKPDTKIEDLKEEHISHLIKMTRDFSLIFYKCRKTGASLEKHMKVYKREQCGECQGKITVCRQGEDNGRMTYFCPHCQTNDLRSSRMKLPTKNSLLGWLQTGGKKTEKAGVKEEVGNRGSEDWACQKCTLLNASSTSSCSVCLAPRYPDSPDRNFSVKTGSFCSGSSSFQDSDGHITIDLTDTESDDTSGPPPKKQHLDTCRFGESSVSDSPGRSVNSRSTPLPTEHSRSSSNFRTSSASPQASMHPHGRSPLARPTPSSSFVPPKPGSVCASPVPPSPRFQSTKSASQGSVVSRGNSQVPQPSENPDPFCRIPFCPGHNQRCSLKQSHKEGPNKRRWFFACAERVSTKRCNFFEWADSRFPICPGHGKAAALCTVLKPGANNGRKFFACPKPRKQQCEFFQWAEGFG